MSATTPPVNYSLNQLILVAMEPAHSGSGLLAIEVSSGLSRASEDPGFAHTVCAGFSGVAGLLGQFVWVTLVMY